MTVTDRIRHAGLVAAEVVAAVRAMNVDDDTAAVLLVRVAAHLAVSAAMRTSHQHDADRLGELGWQLRALARRMDTTPDR